MTLDATKPLDSDLGSLLAGYIRENRTAINALTAGTTEIVATTLSLSSGSTTFAVGTDVSDVMLEIILLSALGASSLSTLTGGVNGQVKIFIAQDNDVSFVDGTKSSGQFYLNQLPAAASFDMSTDDVLILVNVGGDGSSEDGYWKEIYRSISVK